MRVKWLGPDYGLGDDKVAAVSLAAFVGHLFPVFLSSRAAKGWRMRQLREKASRAGLSRRECEHEQRLAPAAAG